MTDKASMPPTRVMTEMRDALLAGVPRYQRQRRRRAALVSACVVVLLLGGVVLASALNTSGHSQPVRTAPGPAPSRQEVLGGLTVELIVPATVRSGSKIRTAVRAVNESGHPVIDPRCVLGNSRSALVPVEEPDAELWGRTMTQCADQHTYEPGASEEFGGPSFPATDMFGSPLPVGEYLASWEVDGKRFQYPVTVLDASGPSGDADPEITAINPADPEEAARLIQEVMAGEWIPVGSSRKPVSGYVNGDLWRAYDEAQRIQPGQPITDPRFQFTDDEPGLPVYAADHTTLIGYWVAESGLVLLDELGHR